MDKPRSMPVKDYLMRVMSVRTNTPLKIIEAVVNHQMQALNQALQTDEVYSTELSGFGKFIFNHKKALKKYEKNLSKKEVFTNLGNKENISEKQKSSYALKLKNTVNFLEGLKPKLQKCPSLQNISILQ